jgi:hypothetical protein
MTKITKEMIEHSIKVHKELLTDSELTVESKNETERNIKKLEELLKKAENE